jgi:hypothetical protein
MKHLLDSANAENIKLSKAQERGKPVSQALHWLPQIGGG